jgi:hypothetical protein
MLAMMSASQETWWISSTMLWVHTCVLWLCNLHVIVQPVKECETAAPFTSLRYPILFILCLPAHSVFVKWAFNNVVKFWFDLFSKAQFWDCFGPGHTVIPAWHCNIRVRIFFCIICLPALPHRVCVLFYFEFDSIRYIVLAVKNMIECSV